MLAMRARCSAMLAMHTQDREQCLLCARDVQQCLLCARDVHQCLLRTHRTASNACYAREMFSNACYAHTQRNTTKLDFATKYGQKYGASSTANCIPKQTLAFTREMFSNACYAHMTCLFVHEVREQNHLVLRSWIFLDTRNQDRALKHGKRSEDIPGPKNLRATHTGVIAWSEYNELAEGHELLTAMRCGIIA